MIASPTLATLTLTDFVRADAGVAEAQHDLRVAHLFTAYRSALHGQKTPLIQLAAQCAMYSTPKACIPLTDSSKVTQAARRACSVYQAYKMALDSVGTPSRIKASADEIDAQAACMAGEFVGIVTAALAPAPVDAAAQAKAKAERDAKAAQAKAQAESARVATLAKARQEGAAQAVEQAQASASAQVQATLPTLAEMAMLVANAVRQGMLDASALQALDEALDSVAEVEIAYLPIPIDALDAHA